VVRQPTGFQGDPFMDTTRLQRDDMSIQRAAIGHICTCNGE